MHQVARLFCLIIFFGVFQTQTFALDPEPSSNTTNPEIRVWNRRENLEEVETVYGDRMIRWLYQTRIGQGLADHLLSQPWFSRVYGYYQSSFVSGYGVDYFAKNFKIPLEDFEGYPYSTFNDFFIRKFKQGVRPFTEVSEQMPAFAEGRYYAYLDTQTDQRFPVKGRVMSASALIGNDPDAELFKEGPVLIARLNPTDYHRFHFPDEGRVLRSYQIHGSLQSVNPIALRYNQEILIQNERQVSILETKNFGKLAFVEVGAMCIGKIIQTFPASAEFRRGDEKGYFLFGGSTVIVLGQKGMWKPDLDLLKQTESGRETRVQLGERIAVSSSPMNSPSPLPQESLGLVSSN